MTKRPRRILPGSRWMLCSALTVLIASLPMCAGTVSLQTLVTPSTMIVKDDRPVTFALYGFIEFKSLAELFPYIESQTQRWNVRGALDDEQRRQLAGELLRRGIESRVVSMEDERPLETLVTHTQRRIEASAGARQRTSSRGICRCVSGGPGEVEAFAELLERVAVDRGTRAFELVSD